MSRYVKRNNAGHMRVSKMQALAINTKKLKICSGSGLRLLAFSGRLNCLDLRPVMYWIEYLMHFYIIN